MSNDLPETRAFERKESLVSEMVFMDVLNPD